MPRQIQAQKPLRRPQDFYRLIPWKTEGFALYTEITAHVEASGLKEVVLTVHNTSGASHEEMASYLLEIIEQAHKRQELLTSALITVDAILASGMNTTAERRLMKALADIRKVI